jgi:hypothetical protein
MVVVITSKGIKPYTTRGISQREYQSPVSDYRPFEVTLYMDGNRVTQDLRIDLAQ